MYIYLGFSLGASQTLNYICHLHNNIPKNLTLAAAISPPLLLADGANTLEVYTYICVCICIYVYAHVYVHMCARVCACVRV